MELAKLVEFCRRNWKILSLLCTLSASMQTSHRILRWVYRYLGLSRAHKNRLQGIYANDLYFHEGGIGKEILQRVPGLLEYKPPWWIGGPHMQTIWTSKWYVAIALALALGAGSAYRVLVFRKKKSCPVENFIHTGGRTRKFHTQENIFKWMNMEEKWHWIGISHQRKERRH